MSDTEKEKAVAVCENCGEHTPVQVWPDGTIHAIGGRECCDDVSHRVLEEGSSPGFATDE